MSGYLKAYALKIQSICLPRNVGKHLGKLNDLGVLNMSGLSEYLIEVLPTIETSSGEKVKMAVYGDGIFHPSMVILRKILGNNCSLVENVNEWPSGEEIIDSLFFHTKLYHLFARRKFS